MDMSYKFYFDKDFDYLLREEITYNHPYVANRRAKSRQRMYANLFTRSIRKDIINENSKCIKCDSDYKLQLDHIIPITKGGLNVKENIQILCRKCNRLKCNKI